MRRVPKPTPGAASGSPDGSPTSSSLSTALSDPLSLPYLITVDETASLLRTTRKAIYAMAERVLATPPRGARPMPETAGYFEDDLDELSNGVVDLIDARRFDEALGACERLLLEYPEVIDGLERSAMVHEARGNHALALDFYRRALAFTELPDQHDGFDEDGREYFRERIAELDARLRSPTS